MMIKTSDDSFSHVGYSFDSPRGVDHPLSPVSQKKLSLLATNPSPSLVSSDGNKSINSAKAVSGNLLKELEDLLRLNEEQIEKRIQELEEREIDKGVIDAVCEIEGWGYGIFKFTSEKVQEGVHFINKILPDSMMKQMDKLPHLKLKKISRLTNCFFTCLDIGARGTALFYKIKIFEQSKEFLEKLKTSLINKDKLKTKQNHSKDLSEEEVEINDSNIEKAIRAWEVQMAIEEKELRQEKISYILETSATGLTLINQPLSFIPIKALSNFFRMTNLIPWIISGIEFTGLAIELKYTREEAHLFSEWTKSYEKFKEGTIDTAQNLLNKRKEITDEKVRLLTEQYDSIVEKIKTRKRESFVKNTELSPPQEIEKQFECWFNEQSKDSLIRDYIDHQETIEHGIKNSLKQMISQKHDLESVLIKFKSTKTHLQFGAATVALVASIAFAVLGLLTIPLGGVGVILLALSIGTAALSIGLTVGSLVHSYYHKPHVSSVETIPFQIKMAWTSLRNSISTYSHQSKEKKMIEIAKILYQLHQSNTSATNEKYQEALKNYQKAKLDFEKSEQKVTYWSGRLKKFESKLAKAEWKDFSTKASLPTAENAHSYDTLEAFQHAFEACDLRFINSETKHILEVQLGINLEALNHLIQENPQEIKKALQEFFILSDARLIHFIRTSSLSSIG